MLMLAGFQVFLVTDLEGHHEIWSDTDFADYYILPAELETSAKVFLCINKLFNDFQEANRRPRLPVKWHFFSTHDEQIGVIVPAWKLGFKQADSSDDGVRALLFVELSELLDELEELYGEAPHGMTDFLRSTISQHASRDFIAQLISYGRAEITRVRNDHM